MSLSVATVMPVVGWLMVRSVKAIDTRLARMDTTISQLRDKTEGAIYALNEKNADSREIHVEMRVRIAQLESQFSRVTQHIDDLGGFLASQGYRKRDGNRGPP